eukprot:TRINITY_DN4368_c0_g1_i15.p1 TRINITY_DN4368_c0_g1~~TRINITY_DN4368_c0_g1_i15.p1  ORF type:complete len:126 (+),score=17.79 TRINITY_DN4368_c0_g1_i15:176-553(+)
MAGSERLSELVAELLLRVVDRIASSSHSAKDDTSRFKSGLLPSISLYNYFLRMDKYMKCSESCFVLSFIYIDRVLMKNPDFLLTEYNIHRLSLAAVLLAIKYNEDYYFDNKHLSLIHICRCRRAI